VLGFSTILMVNARKNMVTVSMNGAQSTGRAGGVACAGAAC
jgi:hypothetical protein